MASYLFHLWKVQLAHCNGFFRIFFRIFINSIYACLCVQNKRVFFGCAYCFTKRILGLVSTTNSGIKINLTENDVLIQLKLKFTKASNNVKSRVVTLTTLGSVYLPHVSVSVMLRIKWSLSPYWSVVSCQITPEWSYLRKASASATEN